MLNFVSSILNNIGNYHPLAIHFPIAFLFVCPFFIITGCIWKKRQTILDLFTLILQSLGTLGLLIAVKTGEAASERISSQDPSMLVTLEDHLILAERSRLIFCILTGLWLIWVIANHLRKNQFTSRQRNIFSLLFVTVFIYGLSILFDAAHCGGKLVHYHKIFSGLYEEPR